MHRPCFGVPRLRGSRVLVCGALGLAAEVCKNIVLAGIGVCAYLVLLLFPLVFLSLDPYMSETAGLADLALVFVPPALVCQGSLVLMDPAKVQESDLAANFFLTTQDLGANVRLSFCLTSCVPVPIPNPLRNDEMRWLHNRERRPASRGYSR